MEAHAKQWTHQTSVNTTHCLYQIRLEVELHLELKITTTALIITDPVNWKEPPPHPPTTTQQELQYHYLISILDRKIEIR